MLALWGRANYHGGTVWTQCAGIHLQAPPLYYITVQHGQYLSICGLSGIDWLLDTMMMSCHSHSYPVLFLFSNPSRSLCFHVPQRSSPLGFTVGRAAAQCEIILIIAIQNYKDSIFVSEAAHEFT